MRVKAVFCSVQNIGKHVKKTKKHFVWKFVVNGRDHILELFTSMISGKKKLKIDGRTVFEGQKMLSTTFSYSLEVENNMLDIHQDGEKFELLINNQPFAHLYEDGRGHGYDDVTSSSHYRNGRASSNRNNFGGFNKKETLRVNEDEDYGHHGRHGNHRGYGNDDAENHLDDIKHSSRNHRNKYDNGYGEDREASNGWDEDESTHSQGYREQRRDDSFENRPNKYSDNYRVNHRAKTTAATSSNFEEVVTRTNYPKPQNTNQRGFEAFDGFSNFDNKENSVPSRKIQETNQAQVKRNFFEADVVENVVQSQSQQRMTLDTSAQENLFVFGTTREEQTTYSVSIQNQQQQQYQQQQQQQRQQQQIPSTNLDNGLLDLASESETKANNLFELYKQSPMPQSQPQPQTQPQLQLTYQPQSAPLEVNLLQSQPEPSKKDLWQTNLVSLDADDLKGGPAQKPSQPSFIHFNIPNGEANNMNFNRQPLQNNMNMMNYGNMNGFSGIRNY